MTLSSRWRRAAVAAVAAATMVPFAATAAAAPDRTATTTKYQRSEFLQRALGVPANTPVIESVTYDRFQNLLRHTGNFALLIGDPATDSHVRRAGRGPSTPPRGPRASSRSTGSTRTSRVESRSAGTVPNLDIRDSGAIKLVSASRDKYKDAWQNLVAQSLGNGVTATQSGAGTQGQSVVTTVGQPTATTNDSVDPIYDYSTGATPANLTDSYFLVYNTDAKSGAARGQGRVLGQPDPRRGRGARRSPRRSPASPFAPRGAVRVVAGGGQRAPARRHAEHAVPEP